MHLARQPPRCSSRAQQGLPLALMVKHSGGVSPNPLVQAGLAENRELSVSTRPHPYSGTFGPLDRLLYPMVRNRIRI